MTYVFYVSYCIIVFYNKLLLYNDLCGYNAEALLIQQLFVDRYFFIVYPYKNY